MIACKTESMQSKKGSLAALRVLIQRGLNRSWAG